NRSNQHFLLTTRQFHGRHDKNKAAESHINRAQYLRISKPMVAEQSPTHSKMADSKIAIVLVRPSGKYSSLELNSSVLNLTSSDLWTSSPVSIRLGLPLKVLTASDLFTKLGVPNGSDEDNNNRTPNQIANHLFVELDTTNPNFGNPPQKSFFGNIVVARTDGQDLNLLHVACIDSIVTSAITKKKPIATNLRQARNFNALRVLQSQYTGCWTKSFWDRFCDFDSKQINGANARATGNPFQAEDSDELKKLVATFSILQSEMMNFLTKEHIVAQWQTYQTCGCCGMTRSGLLRCSGCRKVMYCDKVCQKTAWKEHKKLPAEIFELVTEKVERSDLLARRQTPRECADKVFRTYCSVVFPRIQVSTHHEGKDSIEHVLEIAQRPIFGGLSKDLTIFIDDCLTCFRSEDSRRGQEGRVLPERHFIRQKLCQLFSSLRLTGNKFNVQILARQGCNCSGNHHKEGCNELAPTTRRNLIDVLDQMKLADLPVVNLEIGGENWTFAIQKLRDFELKSLKLDVTQPVTDARKDPDFKRLITAIAAVPRLEVLHIVNRSPGCASCLERRYNSIPSAEIIFATKFRSLKELHLTFLDIRARQLANFAEKHGNTLEELSIAWGQFSVEELDLDEVQDKTALEVLKEMSDFQGFEVDDAFEKDFQNTKQFAELWL
ncbi:hypothetical protein HII31_12270, partial [Pseudocercospora fuligena]